METQKMPDRLNYSTKAKELIERIDAENYFGLSNREITRSELFLFAMALGVESKSPTEITTPYTGGLILDKSIDGKTHASMYSQFIFMLDDPENELDAITKKSEVYKMAEQYANTGFKYIEHYISTEKSSNIVWTFISELDKQYNAIEQQVEYIYDENLEYSKVAEDSDILQL